MDQHPDHLRYLAELGLVPDAIVTVRARAPFDGPFSFDIGDGIHHLDLRMAQAILVQEVEIEEDVSQTQEEV